MSASVQLSLHRASDAPPASVRARTILLDDGRYMVEITVQEPYPGAEVVLTVHAEEAWAIRSAIGDVLGPAVARSMIRE